MKILVIDDSQIHLQAARQTLVGHELTLCATHDEALKHLRQKRDEWKLNALLTKCPETAPERAPAVEKAFADSLLPYWDAVLCDLLMPAGSNKQGDKGYEHVGQEMPVGWSLALQAALEGAKYVAVVTDMNHHDHPASAMLDAIDRGTFQISGARALMTSHLKRIGITGTECVCSMCGGTGKGGTYKDGRKYDCYGCEGGRAYTQYGKDWGQVLADLTANE